MLELNGLRLLCFDLDQTLVDRNTAVRRYLEDFMDRHQEGFKGTDRAAVLQELLRADDNGQQQRRAFCQWVVERFPGLSASPGELHEDFRKRMPNFVECQPSLPAMLSRYAQRFDLVLITNGTRRMQRAKLKAACLESLFGKILISEEMGVSKPERAIFEKALSDTGRSPDQALMIGDDVEKDIEGARRAGMKTCWVSHTRTFPDYRMPPDLVITTVLDLPEVLPCH